MHSRRTGTLGVVSNPSGWLGTAVLASSVCGVALLGGCDRASTTATMAVSADIDSALPRINGSDADRNEAEKTLRNAINETSASPESQIFAKELLAQVELKSAEALQPQIDANRASLLARNWEIGQLAGTLQSNAGLAVALGKRDPVAVLAAVKKNTADAQGSADAPDWVKTDSGSVPSLAAVTADVGKLNDQVNDLQSKLKQMNDQHANLETQADQLDQQSLQLKGDAAVAQYKQASDLRKQANDLTVQIDQTNVQLSRARADLGVKTGQQSAINAAITDFGNVASQVDQNWQSVQKQADVSTTMAKALVGDPTPPAETDPTGGSTLASKAARLQQLADDDAKLRSQAESHVNSAIDFLNDAIGKASILETTLKGKAGQPDMQDKPEVAAWNGIIAAIDPARLRLELAGAQMRNGNLFAGAAAALSARVSTAALVKSAADAAKITLPDPLTADAKLNDDLTSARQSAMKAYKDSTDTLEKISEGAAPDADKQDAHQAAMYAYYQWSLLDAGSADPRSASEHLKTAMSERDAMTVAPTGLPPDLAIAPVKPLATPAAMTPPGMNPPGMTPPGMTPPK